MTVLNDIATVEGPPQPWKSLGIFAIGGLFAVGFSDESDLLQVVSSQGNGVFNCTNGERVARDYSDVFSLFDEATMKVQGIGPLQSQLISTAGLYGGSLPSITPDGWQLQDELTKSQHPSQGPIHSIFLKQTAPYQEPERTCVGSDEPCELRAYGFSPTGRSFVIASSCQIEIFCRSEQATRESMEENMGQLTMLGSASTMRRIWDTPEEDEAWKHLENL